jgi:hypothetical protein
MKEIRNTKMKRRRWEENVKEKEKVIKRGRNTKINIVKKK